MNIFSRPYGESFSRLPVLLSQVGRGKRAYHGIRSRNPLHEQRVKDTAEHMFRSLSTHHDHTLKNLKTYYEKSGSVEKADAAMNSALHMPHHIDAEIHKKFVGNELGYTVSYEAPSAEQLRWSNSFYRAQVSDQETANAMLEKQLSLKSEARARQLIPGQVDLDRLHEENLVLVENNKQFRKDVKEALSKGNDSYEKSRHLEAYMYGADGTGLGRFNAQELKSLFMELWNLEAYELMVEMMESSPNAEFVQNPLNLEFYAKAILKGRHFNIFNATAIALKLTEVNPVAGYTLLTVIHGILKNIAKEKLMLDYEDRTSGANRKELTPEDLQKNQEKRSIYSKCFPGSKTSEDVLNNYEEAISFSLLYSEEAFHQSKDCRLACRALHRSLEQVDNAEIERWIVLTKLSSLKEGGVRSNNISVVRSYLESQYATDPMDVAEIELAEETLLNLFENERQILDCVASLNDLVLPKASKDMVEKFKFKLQALQADLNSNDPAKAKVRKEKLYALRSPWDSRSYAYKGVNSNFIEGNFKFGAQLPTHQVNRHDNEFFLELLGLPINQSLKNCEGIVNPDRKLQDITDFEEFNQIIDRMIREKFHTETLNLEQLDSNGHKTFDQTVQGLNALYGGVDKESRKLMPDSRTNISTNLILGLGDCRHHSQVKQILFDKWQAFQLDKITEEIFELNFNDPFQVERLTALKQNYENILKTELRTFDCEVHLPVKLQNGYPVWKDGYLVKEPSGKVNKVEEHTMNVKLEFNGGTSKLKEVELRDAFYQTTYPWKSQSVGDPQKIVTEGVSGGRIQVLNEQTGNLETVDITLRPANYAGPKEKYDRGANEAYCIGVPIQKISALQANSMATQIEGYLDRVRVWHEEKRTASS